MNYRVTREIRFQLGAGRHGELTLREGDVVQGSSIRDVPSRELGEYRKAESRHRRDHPGSRLAYFKAEGVIRYAAAMEDLMPTKAQPTVPPEATRER